MQIPIYQIDMETEEHGLQKVSFVESPAMESDFIALTSEDVQLAKNEMKQILTGALIIPDKKILRMDAEGNPFYIVFSKEQIEDSRNKFFKESKINLTNYQHDYDLEGNYIVEAWIVEDSDQDKSVALGLGSFPVGTLMVSYKVESKEFWEKEVLTGNVKGFSLEGLFSLNEIKLKKENKMSKPILKTILSNLKELFKVNLMEMTLEDGSLIWQDEESGIVYRLTEEGERGEVLEDGEYLLEDGSTLVIVEGMIQVAEEEEAEMEKLKAELEEAKSELAKYKQKEEEEATKLSEVEAKLSAMEEEKVEFETKLSAVEEKDSKIAELEAELSKVEAEVVELKKQSASAGIEEDKNLSDPKPMTAKDRILAVSK